MSTFTLKIIALITMFLDHIGLYFVGSPAVLRLLGRVSYPLFLFCMVWGFHYTKNKKIYLLRLYLMSIFMTVMRYAIETNFSAGKNFGNQNIFLSMFIVGVLISTIELFRTDRKKGVLLLGVICGVQILYYILPYLIPFTRSLSGDILTGIVPNLVLNEYGLEFIVLGVLMYYLKDRKDLLAVMYILFCIGQFSSEMLAYGNASQWLMIFSLPLMLRYNNQKGPGMKYFFYLFYPAHIFLLFYLANYVFLPA